MDKNGELITKIPTLYLSDHMILNAITHTELAIKQLETCTNICDVYPKCGLDRNHPRASDPKHIRGFLKSAKRDLANLEEVLNFGRLHSKYVVGCEVIPFITEPKDLEEYNRFYAEQDI